MREQFRAGIDILKEDYLTRRNRNASPLLGQQIAGAFLLLVSVGTVVAFSLIVSVGSFALLIYGMEATDPELRLWAWLWTSVALAVLVFARLLVLFASVFTGSERFQRPNAFGYLALRILWTYARVLAALAFANLVMIFAFTRDFSHLVQQTPEWVVLMVSLPVVLLLPLVTAQVVSPLSSGESD